MRLVYRLQKIKENVKIKASPGGLFRTLCFQVDLHGLWFDKQFYASVMKLNKYRILEIVD